MVKGSWVRLCSVCSDISLIQHRLHHNLEGGSEQGEVAQTHTLGCTCGSRRWKQHVPVDALKTAMLLVVRRPVHDGKSEASCSSTLAGARVQGSSVACASWG